MYRISLALLVAVAACRPPADSAERTFRQHREAFEQARRLAVEQGAPRGRYGVHLTYPAPPASSPLRRRLTALLSGTGVESVEATRDTVDGWHVVFLLASSGMVTNGEILTLEHTAVAPHSYNRFSEVRPLGGDWFVHHYTW